MFNAHFFKFSGVLMKQTYNIKKISEDILYNLGHFNNTESNVINAIDKILEGFTTLEEKYYRTPIIVPAFLMITSKKMFISAITLLQSLQLSSCYPLIRAVLENSIYSFYINSDTQKKNIYLKRNKDSTSKKENKNTFSMREIFKYFGECIRLFRYRREHRNIHPHEHHGGCHIYN